MDGKASAAQNYLEHMLFDGSVKPTKLPLSLLEAITNNFSGDHEICMRRNSSKRCNVS